MAIQYFQPEVWSAQLLSTLEKSLVFGGAPVVNRNYEGEITAFGDTVRVTAVADGVATIALEATCDGTKVLGAATCEVRVD